LEEKIKMVCEECGQEPCECEEDEELEEVEESEE